MARTTDVYFDPHVAIDEALPSLLNEMENASKDLQCEASLLFVQTDIANHNALIKRVGYEQRNPKSLGVQAWEEAASESSSPGTILFFKQLRVDRILRPI